MSGPVRGGIAGERELPAPQAIYRQVLRAVFATVGSLAALVVFLMVWRLTETTNADPRGTGVAGLLMLLVSAWAILEGIFAISDLRVLPPIWERPALQIAVAVMIIGNLVFSVALAALAIVVLTQ